MEIEYVIAVLSLLVFGGRRLADEPILLINSLLPLKKKIYSTFGTGLLLIQNGSNLFVEAH